jgi:hypothetical protein
MFWCIMFEIAFNERQKFIRGRLKAFFFVKQNTKIKACILSHRKQTLQKKKRIVKRESNFLQLTNYKNSSERKKESFQKEIFHLLAKEFSNVKNMYLKSFVLN